VGFYFRSAVVGFALATLAVAWLRAANPPPDKAAELLFLSEVVFPPAGGGAIDFVVDSTGAIYVAGSIGEEWRAAWEQERGGEAQSLTGPKAGPGPVAIPCGPFSPIENDIFVAKLTPDGRQLVYLKFFGGSRDDQAAGIAVDGAGRAVVTGFTESRDFPGLEGGGFTKNLGRDAFVMELSADGAQVLRTTLVGGDDRDEAHDIAIDSSDAIYVTGETVSPDFPALNSLPRTAEQGGVLRSGNGGVTWMESSGGLVERRIRAIVPDPYRDSVVYAATNAGVFRSVDAGASWQAAGRSLVPEVVLGVAADPEDASTLYAATENGVFKTVDAGGTWFSISANLPEAARRVTQVVVDPTDHLTIYVATARGSYQTRDGGQTWTRLSDLELETRVVALDPRNPSTVYISQYAPGGCGFFAFPPVSTLQKSGDGGATFQSILGDLDRGETFFKPLIQGLAVNPLDAMSLYAATTQGVFRTSDGGVTWVDSSEGLPRSEFSDAAPGIDAVVLDPQNPSRLYVLVSSFAPAPVEVFRSEDAGASWQRVDFGTASMRISALAIDPKNPARVYAGTAEQPDADGFVAKLAPGGRAVEFSTVFGGSGIDTPLFVAADGSGHAIIGGNTRSADFPVTGELPRQHAGEEDVFLAKVAVDGASLVYSTLLGGSQADQIHGLAVDPEGAVVVAGQTFSADFPAGNGVRSSLSGPSDAFVAKLSEDGSSIVYSGFLGGFGEDQANGVAVAPGGEVYLTGLTGSANFPVTELGAGCNRIGFHLLTPFLTKLDASGARIAQSMRLGDPVRDSAFPWGVVADGADSAFLLVGGQTFYTRERTGEENRFGRLHVAKFDVAGTAAALTAPCVVNAASLISGPVAPGGIVTVYGNGMGAEEFVVAPLDDAGRLPLELDGTRVLFDGEPGPLVHVQANQISVVAPLSVAGKSSLLVEVERGGQKSAAVRWLAAAAHPGVFTQDFSGFGPAVYNQDWTLNEFANPAHPGEVVSVFLNGGGVTDPPVDPAGVAVVGAPLARLGLAVTAAFDGIPGVVEYAGTAPGKLHGVMQVNVRIPADLRQRTMARDFRMVIAVDGLLSQAVFLGID
jgi:uncharacterized protein (TIGR03437 family)